MFNLTLKKIILFLLFLFLINFYNLAVFYIIIIFFITFLSSKKHIKITSYHYLIIFFSVMYFIFSINDSQQLLRNNLIIYIFSPISGFLIGQSLLSKSKNNILCVLIFIVLSYFIQGFLNIAVSFKSILSTRNVINFWTGETFTPTLQAIYSSLMISLIPLMIVHFRKHKVLSLLITFFGSCGLYFSLLNATRSSFLLFIVSISIYVIIIFYRNKSHIYRIRFLFVLFSFVTITLIIYINDIFNIKTIYENSPLYSRITMDSFNSNIFDDERWNRYKLTINGIVNYPFGGNNTIGYSHNLWLDVGRRAGIIPMIVLLVISFQHLILIYKVSKTTLDPLLKDIILLIFIGFNIQFSIEPILEGLPLYFTTYMLFIGFTYTIYDKIRISREVSII